MGGASGPAGRERPSARPAKRVPCPSPCSADRSHLVFGADARLWYLSHERSRRECGGGARQGQRAAPERARPARSVPPAQHVRASCSIDSPNKLFKNIGGRVDASVLPTGAVLRHGRTTLRRWQKPHHLGAQARQSLLLTYNHALATAKSHF
jgi:hypothetical protein